VLRRRLTWIAALLLAAQATFWLVVADDAQPDGVAVSAAFVVLFSAPPLALLDRPRAFRWVAGAIGCFLTATGLVAALVVLGIAMWAAGVLLLWAAFA
jgi:hypothetical protein